MSPLIYGPTQAIDLVGSSRSEKGGAPMYVPVSSGVAVIAHTHYTGLGPEPGQGLGWAQKKTMVPC